MRAKDIEKASFVNQKAVQDEELRKMREKSEEVVCQWLVEFYREINEIEDYFIRRFNSTVDHFIDV